MAELLAPAEAAQRIHVSTKTLHRLRRGGLISYVAVTDRKILYRAEDCDEFLASRLKRDEPCATPDRPNVRRPAKRRASNIVPFSKRAG
jgi:hypothetical protein